MKSSEYGRKKMLGDMAQSNWAKAVKQAGYAITDSFGKLFPHLFSSDSPTAEGSPFVHPTPAEEYAAERSFVVGIFPQVWYVPNSKSMP